MQNFAKLPCFQRKFFVSLIACMMFVTFVDFASAGTSVYLQDTKLSVQLKDASIPEVLEYVKSKSEYKFVYRSDLFNDTKAVTLDVADVTIENLLGEILPGKGISYERQDNVIVFRETTKKATPPLAQQQSTRIVGGVVSDKNGVIPGVSVAVKGSSKGTITSVDGEYSLTVTESENILVFSFVGMKTQEVLIRGRKTVNVTLEENVAELGEVVIVSTGMVNVDKRLFTGASDRLSASDIAIGGMADISRSLEGRSAGVSVQNVSATFGTAPKIRVRGATSILGNSKPLWVVDGVIIEDVTEVSPDQLSSGDAVTMISSAIAGLNADDIESFNILKDGSATSIYGAKAMAGVIVITTKKGRSGVTKFNYTGEFTSRLKPSYSDYNIMNSQDNMSVLQELKNKGFLNLSETLRKSEYGVYGKMYELINTYNEVSGKFGLDYTEKTMNDYLREAEYRNTDWFDELFNNSIMMNHSLSFSTGSERSTSYMSLSVMTDPGWYKRSKVNRYTFNANSTYNILKNLSINILGNASYRNQHAPGTVSSETDPVSGQVSREFDINPFSYSMNSSRTLDAKEYYNRNYTSFNIFNELDNNYIMLDNIDARFQGEVKWKIIPSLELSSLASIRYSTSSMQHHIKDESNQARAYREMSDAVIRDKNAYLYTDPDQLNSLPVSILPDGGIYEKREYKTMNYMIRNAATWNMVFNDMHIVNAYAGMEVTAVQRTNDWFRGWGMQYNEGQIAFYNYLAFKKSSEDNSSYFALSNTERRSAAYFGTLNYSYKGRYSVNGTMRYEGTNRLGKSRNSRWLPTWNIGGAWNIHEEPFYQAASIKNVMSFLKLKTSYSLTADAGPDYISNSTAIIKSYIPWRPTANDKESGLSITMLGNRDLTYEKKHEFNIGFSSGFFNNRLNFDMDLYWRNNFDLLGVTNTQAVGGEGTKYANIADMKSNGIEFTISTHNVNTKDFKWTTDLTFSWSKQKITNLQSDANMMALVMGTGYNLEGYAPYSLFSIPFKGLDSEGFPIYEINGNTITKNNYVEINFQETGENVLKSLKYEGPTDPVYTGGFGNIFCYKQFRLNLFMTYGFGHVVRQNTIFGSSYSDYYAFSNEFKNRWTVAGDEATTHIPVIASTPQLATYGSNYVSRGYNAYNYSDARVAHGDFIRMKEISLSYDFPKNMILKTRMNDLSLKLQVTNPFLIYAHKSLNGQDPEYYQSGGVSSPLAKQFTFTIRAGF